MTMKICQSFTCLPNFRSALLKVNFLWQTKYGIKRDNIHFYPRNGIIKELLNLSKT